MHCIVKSLYRIRSSECIYLKCYCFLLCQPYSRGFHCHASCLSVWSIQIYFCLLTHSSGIVVSFMWSVTEFPCGAVWLWLVAWWKADINLCKLDSRWCGCTSAHSGPSPSWSQTTGSCLRLKSRTCSWTSSRCLVMQHCVSSMTSSNEHVWLRSVLTRLRCHSHGSSVRTCNWTAQSGDIVKFMGSCPKNTEAPLILFSLSPYPALELYRRGITPKNLCYENCWCLIFWTNQPSVSQNCANTSELTFKWSAETFFPPQHKNVMSDCPEIIHNSGAQPSKHFFWVSSERIWFRCSCLTFCCNYLSHYS